MLSLLITVSVLLFMVALIGYIFAIVKENINFTNQMVEIDSKAVTQKVLDDLDYTVFKLGETRLKIGDEVKIHLTKGAVKGTLLGAKKNSNSVCIVTKHDELVELNVRKIKKLKVLTKYGRLL